MIVEGQGDLLKADAEALINAINCVGVMGRGLALQFREAFPENYRLYQAACRRKEVQAGRMFVTETGQSKPACIINFPTKRHWRPPSRLEDIEAGLIDLMRVVQERGIGSLAVPALGCGTGGLKWETVRPLIEAAFAPLSDVTVILFAPQD